MKKVLAGAIVVIFLCGCSNETLETTFEEVNLKLNYTFVESGSMTRLDGNTIYSSFYDKYIKTKVLTPSLYSLTFTNVDTGAKAKVRGNWNSQDGIRLPIGEYLVEGQSRQYVSSIDASAECIADTVYLNFKENVKIQLDQTSLMLTANYDSYLLLFDATNATKITYKGVNMYSLKKFDNQYALFVDSVSTIDSKDDIIIINRPNGASVEISLKDIPFEKGKYYYFNDLTNSFNIPPMESGN